MQIHSRSPAPEPPYWGQETAFFFDNARTLARIAKELVTSSNENVGAVLFRDADGTNSGDRSQRDDKVKSMVTGFQTEDFDFGVPMVPKPKSEAWLMCALQGHPYQNCERLEEMSGNDDSPRSAKKQLAAALAAHLAAQKICPTWLMRTR